MPNHEAEDNNIAAHELQRATKWWQWVLVYPAFVISILGSIPTVIEAVKSYKHEIPMFSSYTAEKQTELFKRNITCLTGATFNPITTKDNVEISTHVCPSGDVYLQGKRPGWRHSQQIWVAWNDIARDISQEKTSMLTLPDFFSQAIAAESGEIQLAQVAMAMTIICQRWVGDGLLLQRISTPQGCFDQVVNTYNGLIVSSSPVSCNPQC